MKKILFCAAMMLFPFIGYTQHNVTEITLTNTTDRVRLDEPFVLSRTKICKTNESLLPVVKNAKGEYLLSQVDDLDGDGKWDELAFVCNLNPKEKIVLHIAWLRADAYPVFIPRTNVRFGKLITPGTIKEFTTDVHGKENLPRVGDTQKHYPYQMDGPAWENDKMGFRQYFDGRNSRDVFGKKTAAMVLDTVGIRPDGTVGDTYHDMKSWGRDILSVANTFGLGGIAIQLPDTLLRLGVSVATTDNVDSTRYTLLKKGVVRSIFCLDYYGWQVGETKVDLHNKITIWAGKYGYENEITTSQLPPNATLVTGIIANNNDMPYRLQKYKNKYISMSTHDHQTYKKVWVMGMSLILPNDNFIDVFDTPAERSDILKTWCVKIKPNNKGVYRYNCYAAWEITDPRFISRDFYLNMIDEYAANMIKPIKISVYKN